MRRHVQLGDLPPEQPLDRRQPGTLFVIAERDCLACLPRTAGSADAMDVGFRFVGQLVVDHVGNVIDVDATGGDVGGDQDRRPRRFECRQRSFPMVL